MKYACGACGAAHESGQRFCGQCGSPLATAAVPAPAPAPAEPASTAERRNVAILFADLTNFTGLSTELDPEDLHTIVHTYTQRVTATMHAFGGTVERYIGDSVMAVFGFPIAHGDDALRAVRAAHAVHQQVMPELSRECGRSLQASIGISFGEVMGTLGVPGHPEGVAVVGEAVNLASRVQGQAAPGEVLVTDSVRNSCEGHAVTSFVAERTLKGIAQPVRLFRIDSLPERPALARARLIGREREVAVLRDAVQRCAAGQGSVLHLRGEPGIGKTRLLQELQAAAAEAGLAIHSSAYLDFGLAQTLSGIAGAAASLLGISPSDATQERHDALRCAISAGLLQPDDLPLAADTLCLPQDAAGRTLLDAMDPMVRQAALRSFVLRLTADAALTRPLLLMVEDLHWMPPSELAQLLALCELVRTVPLMIASTSRAHGDPLLEHLASLDETHARVLELGPLAESAAHELAHEFADVRWIAACVAQAGGNPLFLQQLLRHAAESGTTAVPGSIRNVVAARLDRLPPADRRAAQCAAVIGQRFNLQLLCQLLGEPAYHPDGLVSAGIVNPLGDDWIFAHALVQEGAHASLLHRAARQLHLQVAAFYAPHDLILRAQHLDRAQDASAPRAYLEAAAEQLASFRFERARELIERGRALATGTADQVDLLLLAARTSHDQGRIQESMTGYRQALDLPGADEAQRCRAWLGLAMGMRMTDDLDGALGALVEAEPLARHAGLSAELGELHYLRGSLHFPRGELVECLQEHSQALALAEQASSRIDEARALSGLGDAHYAAGRMHTAQRVFERCMRLCEDNGFGRIEAANRFMVATVRMYMNELAGALHDALASANLARRVGHQRAEIVSRLTAGWIHLLQDEPGPAQKQAEQGLSVADQLGAGRFRAFLLESTARVKLARGDREDANHDIEEALALARSVNVMRFIGPWILGTRALVCGNASLARESLAEGMALIERGCVSHNRFWFCKHAMETCLHHGELDALEQYAVHLERFTAEEPTPWGQLFIERARVLALLQRDGGQAGTRERARQLRAALVDAGHHEAAQALAH